MRSHIKSERIPTTHDKLLFGIEKQYYLKVEASHLTSHFAALETPDASRKL